MTRRSLLQSTLVTVGSYGAVTVHPHRSAVRLTLRRNSDGTFTARAPRGADIATLERMLAEMLPRLADRAPKRPTLVYQPGWSYAFDEGRIDVERQNLAPGRIIAQISGTDIVIGLGRDVEATLPSTTLAVSNLLKRCAARLAPALLIPQARHTATTLGLGSDIRWEIGRGTGVLGSCYSASRRIRLSALLLFLPAELRRYVVAHELAHLTHADHSAAFHRLCDAYCGHRERELNRAVKAWQWPVLR